MNDKIKSEFLSRNMLLVLLTVCLVAVASVVYLVVRPTEKQPETIISVMEVKDVPIAEVNVLHVIDTLTNRTAQAVEGHRYKVWIVDEAKEGASGIARIGGLVTFVPDTRKGDVVVVEVTRIKTSTADAVVIERLETGKVAPAPERPKSAERPPTPRRDAPASAMVGKIFRGTVTDVGREGDGVVKVEGKIVFVKGAATGEHVEFRITEDAGRFARAEVVAKSPTPYAAESKKPNPTSTTEPPPVAHTDQPVDVGQEHEVTVTEADRRHPGENGVARIENFVVFVPGAKIGDRVRIRITELRARSAMSEVVARLEAEPTAP